MATEILVCTPPSGSLHDVQWDSSSIERLCRDVLESSSRVSKQRRKRTDSDLARDTTPLRSSVELDGASERQTLRSISPRLREAANRGIYFVRPDWDDLELSDANYEATLLARRRKGDVLFFTRDPGHSLRESCEFIVTDPKWLLSRFFEPLGRHGGLRLAHASRDIPFHLRSKADMRRFWASVSGVDESEVGDFEAACVLELLKQVGACSPVNRLDAFHVCFPVMLYRAAEPFDTTDRVARVNEAVGPLATRCYASADSRDAFAYLLTTVLCGMTADGATTLEFFREHVVATVAGQGSVVLHMFDGPSTLSVYRHWNFPVPEALLQKLLVQINGMQVIGSTRALFAKQRAVVCNCANDHCSLCLTGDVLRSVFLQECCGVGLHTDAELVLRCVRSSSAVIPIQ